MKFKQQGFTLVELALVVVWFFVAIAVICGVGYIAWHFISKLW